MLDKQLKLYNSFKLDIEAQDKLQLKVSEIESEHIKICDINLFGLTFETNSELELHQEYEIELKRAGLIKKFSAKAQGVVLGGYKIPGGVSYRYNLIFTEKEEVAKFITTLISSFNISRLKLLMEKASSKEKALNINSAIVS